mgnify:CR=1 FL=1
MVDGLSIANNNGYGISAEWGITSVTDSEVRDNRANGIWFQNFGNFTNNTFTSSGVQTVGLDGYLTGGATLIGNGPDALTHVTMVGNDMAMDTGVGTCGKDGQSVPVGVGQPTLRIEKMTVGGTR